MGPSDDFAPGEPLPPPVWDPPGSSSTDRPAGSPSPRRWRVRGILVLAAMLIAAGVVIVRLATAGGDTRDSATVSPSSDLPVTTTLPDPTGAATTAPPDETLVLTTPSEVTTTVADGFDGELVADDLGAFSVLVPNAMERATAPVELLGLTFARVSASTDLAAYRADDTTIGFTVLATLLDESGLTQRGLLDEMALGQTSCTLHEPSAITSPRFGIVDVDLVDGCGPVGSSSKVGLAVAVDGNLLVCLFVQGPGPADGRLVEIAAALLETVEVAG